MTPLQSAQRTLRAARQAYHAALREYAATGSATARELVDVRMANVNAAMRRYAEVSA